MALGLRTALDTIHIVCGMGECGHSWAIFYSFEREIMSAKKHFDKRRPQEFLHTTSALGSISFKMDVNEIEGDRTIHLDVQDKMPFGHINMHNAVRLRDWLDQAIPWLRANL